MNDWQQEAASRALRDCEVCLFFFSFLLKAQSSNWLLFCNLLIVFFVFFCHVELNLPHKLQPFEKSQNRKYIFASFSIAYCGQNAAWLTADSDAVISDNQIWEFIQDFSSWGFINISIAWKHTSVIGWSFFSLIRTWLWLIALFVSTFPNM